MHTCPPSWACLPHHVCAHMPSILGLPPSPRVCTHAPHPGPASLTPPRPSGRHRVELPVLHVGFPLAVYLTHGRGCLSVLSFVSPSPSPCGSMRLFPMSATLFLPWKQVHLYHFSRCHIHALIHSFLFLTYFAQYDSLKVYPHVYK